MDNYPKIDNLKKEELNTLKNLYIGDIYSVEVAKDVKAIFKFFVSFPESFNTEGKNLQEKERASIQKYIDSNRIKNEKTYIFEFRYSDFVEIDPKSL